ncbi:MAG: DNA polymerase III subunit beta [Bacteriovoracaceae bacterium]
MSFKVEQNKFKDAIHKIVSIVDKKNTRPILAFAHIEAKDNLIDLSATDLEVSGKISIEATVDNPLNFCVNAKNLYDIVRELPEGEITIHQEDKNLVSISSGGINFKLLVYEDTEFPHLNFKAEEAGFTIPSELILDVINKTSHAISQDETRIHLNGLYFHSIDGHLRVVSIDGSRLALVDTGIQLPDSEHLINGMIIPRKGIGELKKLAESQLDGVIKLSYNETYIYASSEYHQLSIRLIARDYPKYQNVIPSKFAHNITLDRNALFDAVRRTKIMSDERSNGIKLVLKENQLIFSANNPTYGEAKEIIPCEFSGKDIEIGFNARFLVDILSIFPEGELHCEVNNELSPIVLKSDQLPNFFSLIMPLKI